MKQLDAHNASLHVRVQISFLRLSRKLKGILGGEEGEKSNHGALAVLVS